MDQDGGHITDEVFTCVYLLVAQLKHSLACGARSEFCSHTALSSPPFVCGGSFDLTAALSFLFACGALHGTTWL
jgi:hypothetical protein